MKRFLVIFCLVAFLGALQSYGGFYNHFFYSERALPYKILLKFAHPTNQYYYDKENGIVPYCYTKNLDIGKDYMVVTIYSKDNSFMSNLFGGGEMHKTVFRLYVNQEKEITRIEVVSDTDKGAFDVAQTISNGAKILLKILMDSLHVRSSYLDEILDFMKRRISNYVGEKIDAKTLCVTSLNYLLSKYRLTHNEEIDSQTHGEFVF